MKEQINQFSNCVLSFPNITSFGSSYIKTPKSSMKPLVEPDVYPLGRSSSPSKTVARIFSACKDRFFDDDGLSNNVVKKEHTFTL